MSKFDQFIDGKVNENKKTMEESLIKDSDNIVLSLNPTYILLIKKYLKDFITVLPRVNNWNHYEYSKNTLFKTQRKIIDALELPNFNTDDLNALVMKKCNESSYCFISKEGMFYRTYRNLPSHEINPFEIINLYNTEIDTDTMVDCIFNLLPWKMFVKINHGDGLDDFDREMLEFINSPIYRMLKNMNCGNHDETVFIYFESILESKI